MSQEEWFYNVLRRECDSMRRETEWRRYYAEVEADLRQERIAIQDEACRDAAT